MVLKFLNSFDTVQQVSGETGNGFCNDHVDFSVSAVLYELLESRPVFGVRSGKTIIHIGADIYPIRRSFDFFFIGLNLHGDGKRLIQIICRDTAVCRNTKRFVFIAFRRCDCGSDLVNVRGIQVFYLPEYGLLFPPAFCFKARTDGLVISCCPCFRCFANVNHAVTTPSEY